MKQTGYLDIKLYKSIQRHNSNWSLSGFVQSWTWTIFTTNTLKIEMLERWHDGTKHHLHSTVTLKQQIWHSKLYYELLIQSSSNTIWEKKILETIKQYGKFTVHIIIINGIMWRHQSINHCCWQSRRSIMHCKILISK